MTDYKPHEYANLFPMMQDTELLDIIKDMRENGYDAGSPVVLYEGKILDGRNRSKAAEMAGVVPSFVEYEGADPLAFVIRHNLHRRHLNESQRGVVASRLANMGEGRPKNTISIDTVSKSVSMERAAEMLNVGRATVARVKAIEKAAPELIEKIENGEMTAGRAWTETKRKEIKADLENIEAQEVKALSGVYDVIVIDPPWDMQKIERDVAPNQVAFDYPTMQLDEIGGLEIPCADNCHVFLWTTQRFLPDAFKLLDVWGMKYVCTFNWHKRGGFQVVGLPQYNNEFILYGRKGTPSFVDTKDFKTSFEGERQGHSIKPDEFYATLRRVTAGRRLDMFNRRKIEGFDGWGNEAK